MSDRTATPMPSEARRTEAANDESSSLGNPAANAAKQVTHHAISVDVDPAAPVNFRTLCLCGWGSRRCASRQEALACAESHMWTSAQADGFVFHDRTERGLSTVETPKGSHLKCDPAAGGNDVPERRPVSEGTLGDAKGVPSPHTPSGQERLCPPWCIVTHRPTDDVTDRDHWGATYPIDLTLEKPLDYGEWNTPRWQPPRIEPYLRRSYHGGEPYLQFSLDDLPEPRADLNLTLGEAEELAATIIDVVAKARVTR